MTTRGMISLVTGAASGLGRATAARLVARGGSVILADLPSSAGEQVAAELGEKCVFAPVDVTNEVDVSAALDLAEARFGRVDCAVNCAGVGSATKTLSKRGPHPLDEFTRVLAKHGVSVSDREMEVLLARFDTNADGRMDMNEFVRFLQPRQHEQWNNRW